MKLDPELLSQAIERMGNGKLAVRSSLGVARCAESSKLARMRALVRQRSLLLLVNACAGYACASAASSSGEPSNEEVPPAAPESAGNQASSGTPAGVASTPNNSAASVGTAAEPALDDAAWRATWRRLSVPSAGFQRTDIVSTPSGWWASSSHNPGPNPPVESFVYRSRDGTHWDRVPLPAGRSPLTNASVAYGSGHYVIAGGRGDSNVVLDSVDGVTWREQILYTPPLYGVGGGRLTYVHDRFFAMGFWLASSLDGENWTQLAHPYPGMFSPFMDIAFGGGQFIGVGLVTLLSPDGVDWQLAPIDCALSGGCEVLPDGTTLERQRSWVFSAEGRYFVEALSSADGHLWGILPTPYPYGHAAGHLMTFDNNQLGVWLDGDDVPRPIALLQRKDLLPAGVSEEDARRWSVPYTGDPYTDDPDADFPRDQSLPDSFDFSWRDGLDCTSARCLILRARGEPQLYLVP